jgi:outer membrane lipoprotein-sorting protein
VLPALALAGCASLPQQPAPGVQEHARDVQRYSAALSVRLHGSEVRGRARALVAFERPERFRLEIPGPAGARLMVLAREGRLIAVFPGERAFYEGQADAAEMKRLIGIALAPAEMMEVLLGVKPAGLETLEVRWGPRLPVRLSATLGDGARLRIEIEDAEPDPVLPVAAFAPPPHDGYRSVGALEARSIWSR